MDQQPKWISATEVASYVYCPEAWRLELGLRRDSSNFEQRQVGQQQHEQWRRQDIRSSAIMVLAGLLFIACILLRALS